jgi:hypothetical protein
MTTTIAQKLKEVFFAFEGRPVWGGTHSHGSHFMLEFAERIGRVILKSGRAATFGEGSLLVLGADWAIYADGAIKATANDPPQTIQQALSHFEGLIFRELTYDPKILTVTLGFDGAAEITLGPSLDPEIDADADLWALHLPDGLCFRWTQGGRLELEP